jgi:hypothetical protein
MITSGASSRGRTGGGASWPSRSAVGRAVGSVPVRSTVTRLSAVSSTPVSRAADSTASVVTRTAGVSRARRTASDWGGRWPDSFAGTAPIRTAAQASRS